jgi:hypothetical protein
MITNQRQLGRSGLFPDIQSILILFPNILARCHFFIVEQAVIQGGNEPILFDIHPDEHNFLPAVTPWIDPIE